GARDRRGRRVQPRRARPAARPRRQWDRPDLRPAARADRRPAGAPPPVTLRLVVATANSDKAGEIVAVLQQSGADVDLVAPPDDVAPVDETGTTLIANARLKAEALRDATGLAALGEDTGLEIDSL